MITASTIRNIVAVMQSIDRHELEKEAGPLSDVAWSKFRDDAHQSFLHMPDAEQEAIARIVSARMEVGKPNPPVKKFHMFISGKCRLCGMWCREEYGSPVAPYFCQGYEEGEQR